MLRAQFLWALLSTCMKYEDFYVSHIKNNCRGRRRWSEKRPHLLSFFASTMCFTCWVFQGFILRGSNSGSVQKLKGLTCGHSRLRSDFSTSQPNPIGSHKKSFHPFRFGWENKVGAKNQFIEGVTYNLYKGPKIHGFYWSSFTLLIGVITYNSIHNWVSFGPTLKSLLSSFVFGRQVFVPFKLDIICTPYPFLEKQLNLSWLSKLHIDWIKRLTNHFPYEEV